MKQFGLMDGLVCVSLGPVSDVDSVREPSNTKLSRTSTPKVRTGCVTCKRRHVKCDEARPSCSNCLKSRGHCEGYAVQPRKTRHPPGQLRWEAVQPAGGSPPVAKLQLNPDLVDFHDARGMLYFREFVDLVQSPWVAAASNDDLWGVTLPQLALQSDTLRCAATGIGALSTWYRHSASASLQAASLPALPSGDTHHSYAVACYCRSLKLQSQQASAQDAVFLSVLSLIFETLRGNRKTALDHVNHGLALLLALLTDKDSRRHVANLGPNPTPLLESVGDIFTQLLGQARSVLRGRVGDGHPLPNLAKGLENSKHTMESFMVRLSQMPRSSETLDSIPTVFDNLDEFEKYWTIVRRGRIALAPIIMEVVQRVRVSDQEAEEVITAIYSNLLGNPQVKRFCEESTRMMQALNTAFLPLFNTIIMSDADSPTYLRAILLRLQFLAVYFFEDPANYLDVESLVSRTHMFREYLSLAGIALRTAKKIKNPAHRLSLQCALAWCLTVIGMFCRDPLTRDEAVSRLEEYPGQDGLWNTRSLYLLALRNRVVERANAVEGTPQEQWQRLWRREFVFEDGGDRILLRYLEKDTATEQWQLVEEAAEVREDPEQVHWVRQPITGASGLLMLDLYASTFKQ
ncbi:hypothetical protein ACJ41O_014491 [Fusarium nematophilum]